MDMLEGKGPAEGYALKSCEVKDKEATFKLKTVLSGKSIEPWYGFYCYRFGFWR